MVQRRILAAGSGPFLIRCTDGVKDFLLREGIDYRYGARHLKRAIERYLLIPLSNLIATQQITPGDVLLVEMDETDRELRFRKGRGMTAVLEYDSTMQTDHRSYGLTSSPMIGF